MVGGLTTFWLAYSITHSYGGSLLAGYIFTFSQYHFSHAEGHLNLVSLEWIPLFVLWWYKLVTKPTIKLAVLSGITLFAVILCDYYYFLYCVMTAVIITIWYSISTRELFFFLKKKYLITFGVFILITLATSGILVISLLWLNRTDRLPGHNPFAFSLDLLAPFIPGGHWRFHQLTEFYWSRLPGNIHESSVFIGISVVVAMVYGWSKRREAHARFPSLYMWFGIVFFFFLFALGPALHIGGEVVIDQGMPYSWFQTTFPILKISGTPVRMIVMVTLGTAVISAIAFTIFFQRLTKKRLLLAGVLLLLLIVESLPKPLPASNLITPKYVEVLKNSPDNGGFIDTVNLGRPLTLYYQTIHQKPVALGYISRYPTSVIIETGKIIRILKNKSYHKLLHDYDIHYLLTVASERNEGDLWSLKILYSNQDIKLSQVRLKKPAAKEITSTQIVTNSKYLGRINSYDGTSISGWALIPELNTIHSKIFVLLTDGQKTYKLKASKLKKPGVSDVYKKEGLYDNAGYEALLTLYDIPEGNYEIGILVENRDKKALKWKGKFYAP